MDFSPRKALLASLVFALILLGILGNLALFPSCSIASACTEVILRIGVLSAALVLAQGLLGWWLLSARERTSRTSFSFSKPASNSLTSVDSPFSFQTAIPANAPLSTQKSSPIRLICPDFSASKQSSSFQL